MFSLEILLKDQNQSTRRNDRMNNVDLLIEYLPFLIPLIILEVVLAITALIHVLKHPNYRFGNKIMWVIIVLFVQIIGPVLYFTIGRCDD